MATVMPRNVLSESLCTKLRIVNGVKKSLWNCSLGNGKSLSFGLYFALSLSLGTCSPPIVVDPPFSKNATKGEDVSFYCSVTANEIDFIVNKTFANDVHLIEQGFHQSDTIVEGNSRIRSLSFTAEDQFNTTLIICQALTSPQVNFSKPAMLLVQGPLSMVGDLNYSFIDSSTVNISWSPPFTLPGTNITGYNISATSNGTATNYFTSNCNHELPLTDITDSPCNEIIITVSGYNGLNGKNESLKGIYLPSGKKNVLEIETTFVNDSAQIDLTVNVSHLCDWNIPTHVYIEITSLTNSQILVSKNVTLIRLSNSVLVTTIKVPLIENCQKYSGKLKLNNQDDPADVIEFSYCSNDDKTSVTSAGNSNTPTETPADGVNNTSVQAVRFWTVLICCISLGVILLQLIFIFVVSYRLMASKIKRNKERNKIDVLYVPSTEKN